MSEKWEVGEIEPYGDVQICNVGEKLVHTMVLKNGFMTAQEVEDRANRIAALPDLEANYKEAVEVLKDLLPSVLKHIFLLKYKGYSEPAQELEFIAARAKVALAKAEGK